MNGKQMQQILEETSYVRTGGTKEELQCAEYLKDKCSKLGLQAVLEPFEVKMFAMQEAKLWIDGKEISCKGYYNGGSGNIQAPLYYLTNADAYSLSQCRGKIVLIDAAAGYWMYQDFLKHGVAGFITYEGNLNFVDRDIDQKELRFEISEEQKIPGVNIHVRDAVEIVKSSAKTARIQIQQTKSTGTSYNVVLDLAGEKDEWIILSAHYDSTYLSKGIYDNMSSCIALLYMAEYFVNRSRKYGLRFLWCGSEERGLLGSKAYCDMHAEDLQKTVLNINMDMLGCAMGCFVAFVAAEERAAHYIEYLAAEYGFGIETRYGLRSSDSNSFADKGVPAVSFARYAPGCVAPIHTRYDNLEVMSAQQLEKDIEFITIFIKRMVEAKKCPISKEIPDKIREDLDVYFWRKRK